DSGADAPGVLRACFAAPGRCPPSAANERRYRLWSVGFSELASASSDRPIEAKRNPDESIGPPGYGPSLTYLSWWEGPLPEDEGKQLLDMRRHLSLGMRGCNRRQVEWRGRLRRVRHRPAGISWALLR